MLIDWFTVGAQTLNFVILVWLMKHFLYQPVLSAIDQREQRIAAELADADAKKAEAQQTHDEFQQKNAVFDQQRAQLLRQTTDQANAELQRLLVEAKKTADDLRNQRMETLHKEVQSLNTQFSHKIQQEVFAITRKVLADLADADLEERLAAVFTRHLAEMDVPSRQGLGEALKTVKDSAILRCAFDLPAEQRAVIQNALNESFAADIVIRFETVPDLIGGIELSANGWKLAWSMNNYLNTLENLLRGLSIEPTKPESTVVLKPKFEADK